MSLTPIYGGDGIADGVTNSVESVGVASIDETNAVTSTIEGVTATPVAETLTDAGYLNITIVEGSTAETIFNQFDKVVVILSGGDVNIKVDIDIVNDVSTHNWRIYSVLNTAIGSVAGAVYQAFSCNLVFIGVRF